MAIKDTKELTDLFLRKAEILQVDVSKKRIDKVLQKMEKSSFAKYPPAQKEMLALRSLLQKAVLGSFVKFLEYTEGPENILPFQRKILHFIETGELPEEWKTAEGSFFKWNPKGYYGNILVLIPRSLRKTTLFSRLPAWKYLKDMNRRCLFSHHDLELSKKNLFLVRNLVMDEELQALFPDRLKTSRIEYNHTGGRVTQYYLLLTDKTEYGSELVKAKEGNFEATALGIDLASQHYHEVYMDDLVVDGTSKNEKETEKVCKYVDALNPLAVNLNEGINIVATGTSWYEGSWYELVKEGDVPFTIFQMPAAWDPIDVEKFEYKNYLCEDLLGPQGLQTMFNRTRYKPFFWSQFFMKCIPIAGDCEPLSLKDFIVPPDVLPSSYACMNILCLDPISRERDIKRPDKSTGVGMHVRIKDGIGFVTTGFTFNAVPDVQALIEDVILYIARNHIDAVIVEKVHAQKWLGQLLMRALQTVRVKCSVLTHQHSVNKRDHIFINSGLQGVLDSGVMFIPSNETNLIKQIRGEAPIGDELDALAFLPSELPNWDLLPAPKRNPGLNALGYSGDQAKKTLFLGTKY